MPLLLELVSQLRKGTPEERAAAAGLLLDGGREGLEAFLECALDHDGSVNDALRGAMEERKGDWGYLAVRLAEFLPDQKFKNTAAAILGTFGEPGLEALTKALQDPRMQAGAKLDGELYDGVGDFLVLMGDTLNDEALNANRHLIWTLSRRGVGAFSYVQKLIDSDDLYAQRAGVAVLHPMGHYLGEHTPPESLLRGLVRLLSSSNRMLRRQVLLVINLMGPMAKGVENDLTHIVQNDSDTDIVNDACHALGAIAGSGPETLSALITRLNSDDREVAKAAAYSIKSLGAGAAPAVPHLVNYLHRFGPVTGIACSAYEALGAIGEAAIPAIRGLLADPTWRDCGLGAIRNMGPEAIVFVDDLVDGMRRATDLYGCDERQSMQHVMQKVDIGKEAMKFVVEFDARLRAQMEYRAGVEYNLELIRSSKPADRDKAASRLSYVKERFEEVSRAIFEASKGEGLEPDGKATLDKVQDSMFKALRRLGPNAAAVAPELADLIGEENALLSKRAALTLMAIGRGVPVELAMRQKDLLKSENAVLRQAGLAVFMACGEPLLRKHPKTLRTIVARLKDPAFHVRRTALRTLGAMGPAAIAALPNVREAKFENHFQMVEEASAAIEKILG